MTGAAFMKFGRVPTTETTLRRLLMRSARGPLEQGGVHVEVRVDRGHVVLLLERLDEPDEAADLALLDRDARGGPHRELGRVELDAARLERLADGHQVRG